MMNIVIGIVIGIVLVVLYNTYIERIIRIQQSFAKLKSKGIKAEFIDHFDHVQYIENEKAYWYLNLILTDIRILHPEIQENITTVSGKKPDVVHLYWDDRFKENKNTLVVCFDKWTVKYNYG